MTRKNWQSSDTFNGLFNKAYQIYLLINPKLSPISLQIWLQAKDKSWAILPENAGKITPEVCLWGRLLSQP
jgi:hypothetical protein